MSATRREIIDESKQIIARYDYAITVRQLYYRLVAALIIENNQKEYKRVVGAMTAARKSREISPTAFADPTRRMLGGHGYLNLAQYVRRFRRGYYRDPWQEQSDEVWVMVEKEALASVFSGPCAELFVPLMICRGYPSISALYRAAQSLSYCADRRELHILYFGDHDPSGKDIDRNIADEIDTWTPSGAPRIGSALTRIALTWDQIERYQLPPMPEKAGDSRTVRFQQEHGEGASVELDALDPAILDEMVRREIHKHIDPSAWAISARKQKSEQARLERLIDSVEGEEH